MLNNKQKLDFNLKSIHSFGVVDCFSRPPKNITSINLLQDLICSGLDNPLVIGEGSNLVFLGNYSGDIIVNNIKGIKVSETADSYILDVAGGESWSELVVFCLKNNIFGLENMAMIPGTVGAAPVQNIGAYGVDFSDFCVSVSCVNLISGELLTLSKGDCNFSYRDSIFKKELTNRVFIYKVRLSIPKAWKPNLNYAGLSDFFQKTPTAIDIFNRVCSVRKQKLPDINVIGNSGSFFKNPVVSEDFLEKIKLNFPCIPYFRYQNNYKLYSGWLIDNSGLRIKSIGNVSIYDNHSLVIVNKGGAVSSDLFKLINIIKHNVQSTFNINMKLEVRLYADKGEFHI